jgi:hypothetical protein
MPLFARCAAAAAVASIWGCTLAIKKPAKNASVDAPVQVEVDYSANVDHLKVKLDGQELPFYSSGWLFCPAPGSHVLDATGEVLIGAWNYGVSAATTPFAVGRCPLCFACGAGEQQDPATCRCCQGGTCDALLYANFGPFLYGSTSCSDPVAQANDCLNQNCLAICGNAPAGGSCDAFRNGPESLAVAFSPPSQVRLTWILLALSHQQGTNAYVVSIAEDAAGVPGAALETISLTGIRSWSFPVSTPLPVPSGLKPTLQANRRYWIVVSPGASDTLGCWNLARGDASDGGNQAANTTPGPNGVPSPAGPWSLVPAGQYNLRSAFEVDGR